MIQKTNHILVGSFASNYAQKPPHAATRQAQALKPTNYSNKAQIAQKSFAGRFHTTVPLSMRKVEVLRIVTKTSPYLKNKNLTPAAPLK